jgi:hypothetical protein
VCRERLGEAASAYTPVVAPARTELADTVLREVRETAPAVVDKANSPHWHPVPAKDVMDALEPWSPGSIPISGSGCSSAS